MNPPLRSPGITCIAVQSRDMLNTFYMQHLHDVIRLAASFRLTVIKTEASNNDDYKSYFIENHVFSLKQTSSSETAVNDQIQ